MAVVAGLKKVYIVYKIITVKHKN